MRRVQTVIRSLDFGIVHDEFACQDDGLPRTFEVSGLLAGEAEHVVALACRIEFDEFLGALSSRKRKNIRKERLTAHRHGLEISMLSADQLELEDWRKVHALYVGIYDRKHGTATLTANFFQHLGENLKDNVLVVMARDQGNIVAASLFFRSDSHLYGRVWG